MYSGNTSEALLFLHWSSEPAWVMMILDTLLLLHYSHIVTPIFPSLSTKIPNITPNLEKVQTFLEITSKHPFLSRKETNFMENELESRQQIFPKTVNELGIDWRLEKLKVQIETDWFRYLQKTKKNISKNLRNKAESWRSESSSLDVTSRSSVLWNPTERIFPPCKFNDEINLENWILAKLIGDHRKK